MSSEPALKSGFRWGKLFGGYKVARSEPNGPYWFFRDGQGNQNRLWFGITQELRPGVKVFFLTAGRFCFGLGWMVDKAAYKKSLEEKEPAPDAG